MSRVGKMPIEVPSAANVTVEGALVTVKGPKGEMSFEVTDTIVPKFEDGKLSVAPRGDILGAAEAALKAAKAKGRKMTLAQALPKEARAMWGTTRARLNNMVEGATNGYAKTLELQGVGYRAQMQGSDLKLSLGFSHDVVYKAREGISIKTPKPTEIVIEGADKQVVGQTAAEIRKYRPPEPYKGKGVHYQGQYVRRKEGKKK